MIDARQRAVVIRNKATGVWEDRTEDVSNVVSRNGMHHITFTKPPRTYPYGPDRVRIVAASTRITLSPAERAEVDGAMWSSISEVCLFRADVGSWAHLFTAHGDSATFYTRQEAALRVVRSAAEGDGAADVLAAWKRLVAQLPEDDPVHKPFSSLEFVHPASALSRLLRRGDAAEAPAPDSPVVLPFGSNMSQRAAVRKALSSQISVIDGPPGTGKTQTILNIVANLVLRGQTVGIVSSNNSAVDNVGEKLVGEGVGFIAAELGRLEKRSEFFDKQLERTRELNAFLQAYEDADPDREHLARLDAEIEAAQATELQASLARQELAGIRLESKHFDRALRDPEGLPDLSSLPLLRKSSDTILDYLATSDLRTRRPSNALGRVVASVADYFRFGRTAGLDASATETVLALQRAFYDRRAEELTAEIERCDRHLQACAFVDRVAEHRALSWRVLRGALRGRYGHLKRRRYESGTYRRAIGSFLQDYPVVLSTCHSLRASIGIEALLDYLIVDEASQVDLLAAAPALACARNLIVVGDLEQLPHIVQNQLRQAPRDERLGAFDYHQHSLLSSVIAHYGTDVPRTLLREHYRCHPAIIGFSNQKFYGGGLVPYTTGAAGDRPLVLVRAPEGNHMRVHEDKARSNQREIDIILREVIPNVCADIVPSSIGITTPYRRQADKASVQVMSDVAADTVHRFQGREKSAVIMSTVIDDSRRGRMGVSFVDDPKLVNVAVSRAMKRFVLVTNNELLPTSRHLRDLIGYIEYHNPDEPRIDSEVISVFDLLYKRYSERLRPLAKRLKGEQKYRSEDIVWTVLRDLLSEEHYAGLSVVPQVLLANLFPVTAPSLTDRQRAYMRNRASVDFAVYSRVTKQLGFAIEVDGFAYHENSTRQRERDALKDAIFASHAVPLLRLSTTGSDEERRIRHQLDRMLDPAVR